MQSMAVIRWAVVGAFFLQTAWAYSKCGLTRQTREVKIKFRGEHLLTMTDFDTYITNKSYIGVYELVVPGQKPSIYGLEQTITPHPAGFRRRCLFDQNPFTEDDTCREVIAIMENLVENKAVFVLKPDKSKGPTRIEAIFSSWPEIYTLSALCFAYSELPNTTYVSCPKNDTMIVLKVLAKQQPLNQLPWEKIVLDMKRNTNVQFGGQNDLMTLFLAGYKNTC